MGNIFSGGEVVELGIQIEMNGRDFYNTLSAQSKNLAAAEMFKFLAGEEEKHIQVFKEISHTSDKFQPEQPFADEYYAYINALASDYVFTQKDKGREIAQKITGDREAVEMGIAFEKDSIIFYEGIKKFVPEYEQHIVDELIKQEQSHLLKLSDLRKTLNLNNKTA